MPYCVSAGSLGRLEKGSGRGFPVRICECALHAWFFTLREPALAGVILPGSKALYLACAPCAGCLSCSRCYRSATSGRFSMRRPPSRPQIARKKWTEQCLSIGVSNRTSGAWVLFNSVDIRLPPYMMFRTSTWCLYCHVNIARANSSRSHRHEACKKENQQLSCGLPASVINPEDDTGLDNQY
jgi:hypothetical protein